MKVIYNGGTMSYNGCSDPKVLVIGKVYEVVSESVGKWQTDYTLKGIKGQFNSIWFDRVLTTYFAISSKIPVKGEHYECCKLIIDNNNMKIQRTRTSTVKKVSIIGQDTYKVITRNSIYVVTVK